MEAVGEMQGPEPIAARRLWFFLFPLGGLASCAALAVARSFWGLALGVALFLACVAAVVRKARPDWSGRRVLGLTAAVMAFIPIPYVAMVDAMSVPHVTWLLAGPLLWLLPWSVAGYVLTLPLALCSIAGRFGVRSSPWAAEAVYCPALWLMLARDLRAAVVGLTGLFVAFGLAFLPPPESGRLEDRTRRFSLLGVLEVVGFLSAVGFATVLCLYVWRWTGPSWHLVAPLLVPLVWLPSILPERRPVAQPDVAT